MKTFEKEFFLLQIFSKVGKKMQKNANRFVEIKKMDDILLIRCLDIQIFHFPFSYFCLQTQFMAKVPFQRRSLSFRNNRNMQVLIC